MGDLETKFRKSVAIMDKLRSRKGCPWDREQTPLTLKKYLIEEAYELVEALEEGKTGHIVEELGDLFFQVLFQARIAKEKKAFGLGDVFQSLNDKMVRRHPHVFGNRKGEFKNSREVLLNWAGTKKREGKKSFLDGVPKKMPALLRAYRITEKAAGVGFDWRKTREILQKLDEEIAEFKHEVLKRAKSGKKRIDDEIGDILFTVVNVARYLGIDPESALKRTSDKFIKRFHYIEKGLNRKGIDIKSAGLERMDSLWNEAKKMGI